MKPLLRSIPRWSRSRTSSAPKGATPKSSIRRLTSRSRICAGIRPSCPRFQIRSRPQPCSAGRCRTTAEQTRLRLQLLNPRIVDKLPGRIRGLLIQRRDRVPILRQPHSNKRPTAAFEVSSRLTRNPGRICRRPADSRTGSSARTSKRRTRRRTRSTRRCSESRARSARR